MAKALVLIALLTLGLAQDEKSLPDASFTNAEGKTVKLSEYRGKKEVVLLFMRGFTGEFACHYCGVQTKEYKERYEDLKSAGAEVLVILPGATDVKGYLEKVGNADEEKPDPKFQVPYLVLLDKDYSASKTFNVAFNPNFKGPFPINKPATIVIGKDGKILYEYHGKNPSDRPKIEDVLDVVKTGKGKKTEPEKEEKSGPTLTWVPYEEGLKKAKDEKMPILIDFYADW